MSEQQVHTRREFLNNGLVMLSGATTVPLFLDRTAWAMHGPPAQSDDRILVVVQLAGGNDGLNTIVPFEDDLYYKARPRIAVQKKDTLRLSSMLGLHSAAAGLKQLFDDGLLSIIQGVGYPNPDRSHFVATDIWATADPGGRMHDGWIGRYFDCTCTGKDPCDPKLGIALTQESPLAMQGRRFNPVSFESPQELSWRGPGNSGAGRGAFEKLNALPEANKTKGEEAKALAFLQRTAMDAQAGAKEIQKAAGQSPGNNRRARGEMRPLGGGNKRGGGGQLLEQLSMVRRMIAAGLKTRVYYVTLGGFDTHAQQLGRQQQLLAQLGDALAAFTADLKKDGLLDRVLIMTFSEFGRRVAENASQGTDHGAAAPMFVIGSDVKAGLIGSHPSLAQLDRGDLKWQIDFRSVYTTILQEWLKADSKVILGGTFKPVKLFRENS